MSRARQLARAERVTDDDLDAMIAEARLVTDRTDPRRGLDLALHARAEAHACGDIVRIAEASAIVASALRALADFPAAAKAALEALELLRASGLAKGRAMSGVQAALVFFELGDFDRALEFLAEARQDLLTDDDPIADSHCAHAEGLVQSRLGQFDLAYASFERALRLQRRLRNEAAEAVTLNSLGVVHLRRAQQPGTEPARRRVEFAQARELFTQARALADKVGDARLTLLAAINLAGALGGEGEVTTALTRFVELLPLAREHGDRSNESLLLANAGEAARLLGDHARSRSLCEEALRVATEIGSKVREEQAYLQLSRTCEAEGDLAGALAHYKTHHVLEREMHAGHARRLAETHALRAEMERARHEAERQRRARRTLERENRKLTREAREDPLTGLANRRALDEALKARLADAQVAPRTLAVVLFDVDRFKSINDSFTHVVGDRVLREVAAILQAHCRAVDLAARMGGDEFVLLLRESDAANALRAAERVRTEIAARDWSAVAAGLVVTASGGVAVNGELATAAALLRQADRALYDAKRAGRNRICVV